MKLQGLQEKVDLKLLSYLARFSNTTDDGLNGPSMLRMFSGARSAQEQNGYLTALGKVIDLDLEIRSPGNLGDCTFCVRPKTNVCFGSNNVLDMGLVWQLTNSDDEVHRTYGATVWLDVGENDTARPVDVPIVLIQVPNRLRNDPPFRTASKLFPTTTIIELGKSFTKHLDGSVSNHFQFQPRSVPIQAIQLANPSMEFDPHDLTGRNQYGNQDPLEAHQEIPPVPTSCPHFLRGQDNVPPPKRTRRAGNAYEDDDEGVRKASEGHARNCAEVASAGSDPSLLNADEHEELRKICPKTCGLCDATSARNTHGAYHGDYNDAEWIADYKSVFEKQFGI